MYALLRRGSVCRKLVLSSSSSRSSDPTAATLLHHPPFSTAPPAAESAPAAISIRRVGIVGAGPSGFYVAKYLLKELGPSATVEMIDCLPTPFGLVRTGVAPDHPEVKSVQKDFEKVAEDPRFRFFGNIRVGQDVGMAQLRAFYDVVVLAYGASEDRTLGIPGEDTLEGVLSARTFVNWYNGHPDYAPDKKLTAMLRDILAQPGAQAAVLGQGNVALDCARVLAKQPADLASSDICEHALEVLKQSQLTTMSVIGRRGHGQAAFTIKELRELSRIAGATLVVPPEEVAQGLTPFTIANLAQSRPRKRLADLVESLPAPAAAAVSAAAAERTIALRFLLLPKAFLPDPARSNRVGAIVVERARLQQEGGEGGRIVAVGTGEMIEIPCNLVLRSIGYKSQPLEGVPFDRKKAVVPNRQGRVLVQTIPETGKLEPAAPAPAAEEVVPGMYCTGWVKRGPTGIVNTNIYDARETVASIVEDAGQGRLNLSSSSSSSLLEVLSEAGRKKVEEVVTWKGYQKIDAYECTTGAARGKPREKVINAQELVRIATR
eukprot:evm.model.NODE_7041_length_21246_cov_21.304998.1